MPIAQSHHRKSKRRRIAFAACVTLGCQPFARPLVADTFFAPAQRATESCPTDTQPIAVWIERFQSDVALERRLATERLKTHAIDGTAVQRNGVLSRLRSLRTSFSLDTQVNAQRLIEDIRWGVHQRNVQTFGDVQAGRQSTIDVVDATINAWWQVFTARAGHDAEAIEQFQRIAADAGPDWQLPTWKTSSPSVPAMTLTSHLGCRVPEQSIRYVPASSALQKQLMNSLHHRNARHSASDRVLGRLIDATLERNPYGWSTEIRLSIAIVNDRRELVQSICDQIWANEVTRPRDLALSLLAAHQMRCDGVDKQIEACWNDARVITVLPGQAHFGRGDRPWPHNHITTRVQNVAHCLRWQRDGTDAREHGMVFLQADPIWGTRLESIGMPSP